MKVLGIESTAHTFGCGVVDGEGIRANARAMYTPEEGGIHPRKAAEHHYREAREVLHNALASAGVGEADIDAISFARGPGMPPCLDVGAVVARSLALEHDVPLYGVNHVIAHVEIGRYTTDAADPVVLFVSGGNSQVISYAAGSYRVFGETLDIAVGNALDKFARTLGIPHPGGPEVEKLAEDGENLLDMSYVVKGMDVSFSGLVTEAERLHEEGEAKEDICFSFQEHAYAMLVEATERAMAHLEKDELLLTGGVAANARLREMVTTMAAERGAEAFLVPTEYATDNGAMIAWQGVLEAESRDPDPVENTAIIQNWRPEEVDVTWR